MPFCAAAGAISATTSSISGRTATSSSLRRISAASSLEKSRMSLRICKSPRAEASAISARSRCFSGSGSSSISPSSPSTPLIGVRISWLIAARKRDFASVAASASRRRRSSSCSRATSAVTSQSIPTSRRVPSGAS